MSPLEIEILLHYHYATADFRGSDFSAPAVCSAIRRFTHDQLLEPVSEHGITYRLTERGEAHVRALCELPLPVQRRVTPVGHSTALD